MEEYIDYVSDERLDIIEANECAYHPGTSLSTQRFRRLFNEINSLRQQLVECKQQLEQEKAVLVEGLRAMAEHCPNCSDQGWYEVEGTEAGCCGYPTESGECCGYPVPVPVPQQEQCQWCDTVANSKFNIEQLLKKAGVE